MHDQRVETRPSLGLEDTGHGMIVARIAPQPIDRFGGQRDQPAGAQDRRGAGVALGAGAQGFGVDRGHGSDAAFRLLAAALGLG